MKKKTAVFVFFLLYLVVSPGISAQKRLSPGATISILTSSPWQQEIYALFGHTALRVHDEEQGIDLAFNYGVFDFNRPHFIWHFVKGETDYRLGVTSYANYVIEYEMNGLEVIEQVIRMTSEEKECLWNKLLINHLPENREYRYNFFYDNCSTRPFLMIESCINGKIELTPPDTVYTFRDLVRQCTSNFPWLTYGIDLVVAQPADKAAGERQILFLPYHLMKMLESARIVLPDGSNRAMVESQSVIIESVPDGDDKAQSLFKTWMPSPLAVSVLLLLAVLLLFFTGKKRSRTLIVIQALLFGLAGISGLVVFFLSFFSEHPAMFPNWNLLWLHPLQLIVPIAIIIKPYNKTLYFYHFINFVLLLGFVIASPFVSQAIPLASVFFALALALCSIHYIYVFKKQ